MRRSVLMMCLALGLAGVQSQAKAQTAMQEDMFDIQTALHYYGFIGGPVSDDMGPSIERGLSSLGNYLKLGPVPATAVDADPLPLALRTLLDAYSVRNDSSDFNLDDQDLVRLRTEGERFWVRKQLQPDIETWGVNVDAAADTCGAFANEDLIGQEIDPVALPELEGAGSVRVVYFGPVTADLRPDRLNIYIDPWDTVTNLACN